MTVMVPLVKNVSLYSPMKMDDIQAAYPEIEKWVIGGHSLGGAGASMYANRKPDQLDGLIFWDSYTDESNNLRHMPFPVMSIHATEHHDRPERRTTRNGLRFGQAGIG